MARKLQLEARSAEPHWEEICDVEIANTDQMVPLRINLHLPFEDLIHAQQFFSAPPDWSYYEESQLALWFLRTAVHPDDFAFLMSFNPSLQSLFKIVGAGVLYLSRLGLPEQSVEDDEDDSKSENDGDTG